MSEKPYRPNVGMVVCNRLGQGMVGERYQFPGSWQFPQGGIDSEEDYLHAANRELYEEIGIDSATYVGEYPDWIAYDFPSDLKLSGELKKFKGQTQRWILFFWDGQESDCKLDLHEREFLSVRWMDFSEILEKIVPFKRPIYEQILPVFEQMIRKYIASL